MKFLALVGFMGCMALAASGSEAQQLKRSAVVTSTPNHGVVNGTGIGRAGSGPGTVGGATKNTGASINGSAFRPKH